MKRVAVVGAGIAGLTTALHLTDGADEVPGGLEVVVLEGADRAGGNIRTDRIDGYTIEWGPNGYLDNVPATPALVSRLGLDGHVQQSEETASKRFLWRNGRLHELPTGLVSFLRNPVLSRRARLRVLAEPFARSRPKGVDETVHDFVRRRLGGEMAGVLIDAMVSGVFAGDVRSLSLASCFPKMAAMEAEHGGLVKAMMARMRERKQARRRVEELRAGGQEVSELTRPGGPAGPGGTLTSFESGLDLWIEALTTSLGDRVHLSEPVVELHHDDDETAGPWVLRTGNGQTIHADAVVFTPPSPAAAPVLGRLDGPLGETVRSIPTAGLSVVALGYDADAIGGAPDGFGFLVPRGTGLRILGCLWDSSVFPGRAPAGKALLRVMIGGAHDPDAVTLEDEELLHIVREELATAMAITAAPELVRIYRHPLGIGQYTVGHQDRLDRIHERLAELPGLWVAGSSYYGISMNACIERAGMQSGAILRYLTAT